jgi:hypothetical protein
MVKGVKGDDMSKVSEESKLICLRGKKDVSYREKEEEESAEKKKLFSIK